METIVWIDPDGAVTTLHTTNPYAQTYFVPWNLSGRFVPPVHLEEDEVPEQDGSRLRAVKFDARQPVIPVWVQGSSEAVLRTNLRALVRAMNPKRGNGRLRITTELGDQRELVCRVVSGLEGAERIGDTRGSNAQFLPLTFKAWDPYWYDASDTVASFALGTPSSFFPFFPLRLSSSEVFADTTITNVGDTDTWPVWTVTGPGSALVLRNLTTGKMLTHSATLGVSETLTIDTRPGFKSARKNDGTNLFTGLGQTSSLWPLLGGMNAIRIELTGATSSSLVSLAYRPRYLMV